MTDRKTLETIYQFDKMVSAMAAGFGITIGEIEQYHVLFNSGEIDQRLRNVLFRLFVAGIIGHGDKAHQQNGEYKPDWIRLTELFTTDPNEFLNITLRMG